MAEADRTVTIELDETSAQRLQACAAWRGVPVQSLVLAYVEDWIDIDYPESQGRLTGRGIYRDGPIGLCEKTRQETSRNWEAEFRRKGFEPTSESRCSRHGAVE